MLVSSVGWCPARAPPTSTRSQKPQTGLLIKYTGTALDPTAAGGLPSQAAVSAPTGATFTLTPLGEGPAAAPLPPGARVATAAGPGGGSAARGSPAAPHSRGPAAGRCRSPPEPLGRRAESARSCRLGPPREAPKSSERLPPGRGSLLRARPKLPELPHVLGLRSEPKFPERGGHGRRRAERGGAGGGPGRRTRAPREGLRKEPRFPERASPAGASGKSRSLPSAAGPSGSGAARRRPSVRPAGLLEAAAAPCLMLRCSSEENPPASPESRRREGRRCPRGGAPRPPAAGGS